MSQTRLWDVLENFSAFVHENNVSWITGSFPVTSDMTTLYVKSGEDQPKAIVKFPYPSVDKLASLYTDGAKPAAFGKGSETVIDPSYRSAKTIVSEDFAINLRPDAKLLDQIHKLLLKRSAVANHNQSVVRAQLYRVNIYGPGDFFKEHKDTPQNQSGHFGSLVFCLPTAFEGGAFALRDPQGKEMKFDWGAKYAANSGPSPVPIEYVAFASDLDHWIEPVTAGYRVTLTFHLFLEDLSQPALKDRDNSLCTHLIEENGALGALKSIIDSKALHGVPIVFPLVHQYAERDGSALVPKGSDAALIKLLESLGGKPTVRYYYDVSRLHYELDRGIERGLVERRSLDESQRKVDGLAFDAARWRNEAYEMQEMVLLTDHAKELVNEEIYDNGYQQVLGMLGTVDDAIFVQYDDAKPHFLTAAGHYGNEASICTYNGNACVVVQF